MAKRPAKMPAERLLAAIRAAVERDTYRFTLHAAERLADRTVSEMEVVYVLRYGHLEPKKDQYDSAGWRYAVRGKTLDGRPLRIAVALIAPNLLIITVIDLSEDGP